MTRKSSEESKLSQSSLWLWNRYQRMKLLARFHWETVRESSLPSTMQVYRQLCRRTSRKFVIHRYEGTCWRNLCDPRKGCSLRRIQWHHSRDWRQSPYTALRWCPSFRITPSGTLLRRECLKLDGQLSSQRGRKIQPFRKYRPSTFRAVWVNLCWNLLTKWIYFQSLDLWNIHPKGR